MDRIPSFGAMLITAPSAHERLFEMSVRLKHGELKPTSGYTLRPWVRVLANVETGDVLLAAGITVKRSEDG